MKINVRSTVAILFGIVLILGAFYLRDQQPSEQGQLAVISDGAGEQLRNYIQSKDSNGDGVSDWEEELAGRTLKRIEGLPAIPEIEAEYTAPDTLTGKFAEVFFRDYFSKNINGEITPDIQKQFLYDSIAALEQETFDTLITSKDISISNDNSLAALRTYGNEIAEITFRFSTPTENELIILEHALSEEDESILEELQPIIQTYEQYLEATQKVAVPSDLVREHLNLLNVYQALHSDISAMSVSFDDPLLSMIRTRRYQEDAEALYITFSQLFQKLSDGGVVYQEEEPAALFSVLE